MLEIAKAVGIETIYCPYLLPDQRPDSGKGWHAFGQRLQKAGAPYRDAGLGFGWHNHDFEFKKTADGALPQTAIFEGGPDLEWEADIAWVIRGGADPLQWIDDHGRPHHRRARQGHRPRRRERRRGRLGRRRPRHRRLEGADGGAQGRDQRPDTSSWSTTTPRTTSASPTRSLAAAQKL